MEGGQPYLGDLLTMVINHLLSGMILQVINVACLRVFCSELQPDWLQSHSANSRRNSHEASFPNTSWWDVLVGYLIFPYVPIPCAILFCSGLWVPKHLQTGYLELFVGLFFCFSRKIPTCFNSPKCEKIPKKYLGPYDFWLLMAFLSTGLDPLVGSWKTDDPKIPGPMGPIKPSQPGPWIGS